MSAQCIAEALGGRANGGSWMARCPAHDDRKPSLSISTGADGKVLVRCHAGCDQTNVIASLRSRGLWDDAGRSRDRLIPRASRPAVNDHTHPDEATRTAGALRLWRASSPAFSTLAETYIRSRGLHLLPPTTIRFHAGLRHPTGGIWPAMLALVTRGTDNAPLAIHRSFLARDGADKAPIEPEKMMLGPCRGGAVRLAPLGRVLMVGEGIETCLAAMHATGYSAWAALSTSGLRALDLPQAVREVTILADGDDSGEGAARDAATRWKKEGRRLRIARAPRGFDFNDVLLGRTLHDEQANP